MGSLCLSATALIEVSIGMHSHMALQDFLAGGAVGTQGARERLLTSVDSNVLDEITFLRTAKATVWARVRPLSCVCPPMPYKIALESGFVRAIRTLMHLDTLRAAPPRASAPHSP